MTQLGGLPDIPGCTIEGELGRGGMATVYLANQELLDRKVAIKVMRPAPSWSAVPDLPDRFEREARTLARFQHRGIVKVFEFSREDPLYILMEYLPGGTLQDRLSTTVAQVQAGEDNRVSTEQAVQWIQQIADALQYAHERHFVHRDLKPSNIMFQDDGSVVLTDFGIAKAIGEASNELTKQGIGSIQYMSPEQCQGAALDARSDLYSLGIVFYELLTGTAPYRGEDVAVLYQHLHGDLPKLPAELRMYQVVVNKLLAREPRQRYASAREFLRDLSAVDQRKVGKGNRGTLPRLPIILAGGVAGLAAIGTFVWFLTTGQPQVDPENPRIKLLVDRAQREFQAGNLAGSANIYQQIVLINNDDRQATEGLKRIAEHFMRRAQRAREQNDLDRALQLVDDGLDAVPIHSAELKALRKEILFAEDQRRQQLERQAERLDTGEAALAQGDLRTAAKAYLDAISSDASSAEASAGLQGVADSYAELAMKALQAQRLDDASTAIRNGLQTLAEHPPLLAIQELLDSRLADLERREERQERLANHLAAADKALSSGNIRQAAGLYRQALEIDPDNSAAPVGLDQVAKSYASRVDNLLQQQAYREAVALADKGLAQIADDDGLLALRTRAETALDRLEAESELARELDELLRQAGEELGSGKLDQAAARLSEALDKRPNNERALAERERLGQAYLERALGQHRAGKPHESIATLDAALRVLPNHARLQALHEEVSHTLETSRTVQQLLTLADKQVRDRKLTRPTNDNAFATYKRILNLAPDNPDALAGLEGIARAYETLARYWLARGMYSKSLAYVISGLQVLPGSESLQRLQDAVHKAREVDRLLTKASRSMAQGDLVAAVGSYRQVLELDPDHQSAEQGLVQVEEAYVARSRNAFARSDYEQSLQAAVDGLEVGPDNAKLLELKDQAESSLVEQLAREATANRLAELLVLADEAISEDRLDDAAQRVQEMGQIDNSDPRVAAELERIADAHAQKARRAQASDDYEESLAHVARGLEVVPGHAALSALHDEIVAAQDNARKLQRRRETLDAANRNIEAGELDAAATALQELITADAADGDAQSGLRRVGDAYATRAQRAHDEGRHADSLAEIEAGLRAVANHRQLRTLRERVRRSLADQGVQRTLANLLAQAERQMQTGDLRDALASYRRALVLAPTSDKALRGLKQLSERYAKRAQSAIEQSDESGAMSIVEEGLRVDPDFRPLLALRTKLERAQQAKQQRGILRQSLSDAARQLHEGNLEDAVTSYRGAIGIDPTSQAAREGLQAVANAYADRAEQARDEGRFDTGLRAVAEGLRVVPGSQRLVSLQVDLHQQLSDAAAAERRDLRVRELLQQADAQIAGNLLTTPAGGNAFDTLRKVLAIDPDNPEVDAAFERIAERYARFASSRLERGDLESSLDYVESGLQVVPENSRLLSLREQIGSEQARRAALQQEIAALLGAAEGHFAAGQLTAPPGENAVGAYRDVLRIDPSSRQARQGLQRIADRYADRARAQLRAGDLEQSTQVVNNALSVLPQDPTLLALRTEIREALAERSSRAKTDSEVRTLLARAKNEVQAGRLIASTGDDAFGLFQHVLEMAPHTEGALDGLDGIYNHYVNAAREDHQGKRYQEGLLNIERALTVRPSDRVALILQQDLQREMSVQKAADAGLRIAVLPWDLGKDAIGNGDVIARAVADAVNEVNNISITHHFDSRVARRLNARHVPIDTVGIWRKINPERPGQPNEETIYNLAEDLGVDAVLMCSIVEDGEFMFPEAAFALFVVDVKNRKVISQRQVERESSYQAPVGFSAGTGAGIVRQLTRKVLDEYRAIANP